MPYSMQDLSFPEQKSNLHALHWTHGVLTTEPPQKFSLFTLLIIPTIYDISASTTGKGTAQTFKECLFFSFLKINSCRYLSLAVMGLRCCEGFSLAAVSGGYSLRASSCCRAQVLGPTGFDCCGTEARGLQKLWHTGLAAPWHVESSRTRDRIHVPHIGRLILNHWTTSVKGSLECPFETS